MFKQILQHYLPWDWSRDLENVPYEYQLLDVTNANLYHSLSAKVQGDFNLGIKRIMRVENIYLYGQFLLKKAEYETIGYTVVKELFHDTSEYNICSIISENLDWRLSTRVRYGCGVSFSPSAVYANKQSSRNNGPNRAMIVADVLMSSVEVVDESKILPMYGYDTTIGNNGNVYVKYYDNEFYPKYVIFYTSRLPPIYPIRHL